MKIALVACGTRGDVQPALALGKAMQNAGHEILIAAPPENKSWVEKSGCPFVAFGSDFSEFMARFPDGHGVKLLLGFVNFIRKETAFQLEHLPEVLSGADLVISFSLIFSAMSVSEYLNIPCLWTATTPQLFPSREHPPFSVKNNELPPWMNALAWVQGNMSTDLLLKGVINRGRKKMGLAPIKSVSGHILGGVTLVASDPEIAPMPADAKGDYLHAGCYIMEPEEGLSEELQDFLGKGSPPVYVGFGSMAEHGPRMTKLVYQAMSQTGRRLVLAKGWGGLGDESDDGERLLIEGAPHSLLFPRTAAVVHHGGAGTTAAAARAGVPQIIVPHIFDQFYWGKRVHQLGLGPRPIPQSRLTPQLLEKALHECLNNDVYARNAASLAGKLSQSDGVGRTIKYIESTFGRN